MADDRCKCSSEVWQAFLCNAEKCVVQPSPPATATPLMGRIVRLLLTPHPLSRSVAVAQIEVDIDRPRPAQLTLSFALAGDIARIAVPAARPSARRTELWKSTCFEAFIRVSKEPGYYEFNFSPSTEWAAYRFDSYRNGMCAESAIGAVLIDWRPAEDECTLQAHLNLGLLPGLVRAAALQVGLSAVIEERSGSRSYWSLTHPTDKPDFHHPASFAHDISWEEP